MRSGLILSFNLIVLATATNLANPIIDSKIDDGNTGSSTASIEYFATREIPGTMTHASPPMSVPKRRWRRVHRSESLNPRGREQYHRSRKRAGDIDTAGGNAYTGDTSDADGGNIINEADSGGEVNNDGGSKSMITILT